MVVISSIDEAVSSSDEACSSVRCERLALPVEISSAPRCTSAATSFTFETTSAMLSASWLTPRLIASKKPVLPDSSMRLLRSPPTTAVSMFCISFSTATSCVRSVHSTTVPMRSPLSLTHRVGDRAERAGAEHALLHVGPGEVVERRGAVVRVDRQHVHARRHAAGPHRNSGSVLRISC